MKYLAFSVAFAVGVPLIALIATVSVRGRGWALAALVLSIALGDMANINFMSMESYRGPDRGFEVSLTDLLAMGLVASLLARDWPRLIWFPPNSLTFLAFVGAAALGTAVAPIPVFGYFTLFKLGKFLVVYWCVVNLLRTGTDRRYLWLGFVSIALILTVLAVYQKYGLGIYRVHASFDHSNTIPAFANLILPVLLMWGLVDRDLSPGRAAISGFAALGLVFCVVATFSRAGLALSALSVGGAFLLSARRGATSRFLVAGLVAAVLGMAGGAVAADSVIERFRTAPESSEKARDEFNHAALLMAKDHVLGVGLNNFSHVLTTRDRYRGQIEVMGEEEQAGVAHHIYLLTAAELGFLGLIMFVIWIAGVLVRAAWHGLRARSIEASLVGGLFIGMCALHAVGLLEWVFRLSPVLYLFAVVSAAAVGLVDPRRSRLALARGEV